MFLFEQVFVSMLGKLGLDTVEHSEASRYRWNSTPTGTEASVGRVVSAVVQFGEEMRRYNEQIHVDSRPVSSATVAGQPVRFRWRGQVWQVAEIHGHWVATADWWDSPAARALRGEETAVDLAVTEPDVYDTRETWRVSAVGDRRGLSCDLVHSAGRWYLDTMAD